MRIILLMWLPCWIKLQLTPQKCARIYSCVTFHLDFTLPLLLHTAKLLLLRSIRPTEVASTKKAKSLGNI